MKRLRLLIDNFLIYGLSGILGKLLPFIFLPVITRLLPDPYYMGVNDILNTIISFSSAIAVMGMYDAMFRLFFDKEDDIFRLEICSSALFFVIITASLLFILLIGFKRFIAGMVLRDSDLDNLIFICGISAFSHAVNNIIAAPTRMLNKKKIYLIINLATAAASYAVVFVLLYGKAYLYAIPVGGMCSSLLSVCIFWILNRKWFSGHSVKKIHIKELLKIGAPLFPGFLIYWIFNSCDRIMIARMLGMSYTGVYAVGSKFGQIGNLIYIAFAGGWQYFAFSTMKDMDQVELTSKIFECLSFIEVCSTIFLSIASGYTFSLLFDERYSEAIKTIPYLFMAPLIQMLYQIGANQFLVIKKTWPSTLLLLSGAIVNISMNCILIPAMGIEGAALATLCGFFVSTLTCVTCLSKMKLFSISWRCIYVFVGLMMFLLVWRKSIVSGKLILSAIAGLIIILMSVFLFRKEIKSVTGLWDRDHNVKRNSQ
ncbi:lipopolysaccharide biosynthesis protein [Otoolea muris]|uniref:lipopolysaccharide biosynthesis protein n=1 Tax=Otoolea muris TaxID=2941515 RepID=UPI002041D42C|nr:oligosaccharide flippase family protein [Otoolea muris]